MIVYFDKENERNTIGLKEHADLKHRIFDPKKPPRCPTRNRECTRIVFG